MFQNVVVVGNLGGDPEMRYTLNGTPVSNFSVATNEKWTGSDGQLQERTTWWRVAAWGRMAEVVNEYLHKGSLVLVNGTVKQPEAYKRNDGTYGASLEITARTVKFLSPKGAGGAPAESPAEDEFDESIPF